MEKGKRYGLIIVNIGHGFNIIIIQFIKGSWKYVELADLVTEMKEIKHPYKMGISAQRGIEF